MAVCLAVFCLNETNLVFRIEGYIDEGVWMQWTVDGIEYKSGGYKLPAPAV